MCNFTVFMSYSLHLLESMVNKTKHVNLNGNAVNCQLFSENLVKAAPKCDRFNLSPFDAAVSP